MAYKMKGFSGFKGAPANQKDSPLDFDMDAAGQGALTGAKYGAVLGPWGAVAGGVIGGVAAGWETDAMKRDQGKAEENEAQAAEEAENQRQIEAMGLSGVERKGVAKAGSYGATDPLNPTGRPRPEKQPTEQISANRPEPLINKPA